MNKTGFVFGYACDSHYKLFTPTTCIEFKLNFSLRPLYAEHHNENLIREKGMLFEHLFCIHTCSNNTP